MLMNIFASPRFQHNGAATCERSPECLHLSAKLSKTRACVAPGITEVRARRAIGCVA